MAQRSTFFAAAAAVTALLALLWPQLEQLLSVHVSSRDQTESSGSKCPLGYTGPNPHQQQASAPAADTTWYTNCTIWTADPKRPWATYLAVDGRGRVTSQPLPNTSTLAALQQQGRLHDLQGAWVMPGFIDPHLHLIPGGLSLHAVSLRGASSKQEFQQRITAAVMAGRTSQGGPGAWIIGFGWDDAAWGGQLPAASWIDEALAAAEQQQQPEPKTGSSSDSGSHVDSSKVHLPVFLLRMDGHLALVNKAALQLAGVTAATADPEHGTIDRDAHGHPTGILRETAMVLVRQHIPEATLQQRQTAFAAALRHLVLLGVTFVGDMGRAPFAHEEASWEDLEQLYDPAADAGELPLRIKAFVPLSTWGRMATRVAVNGSQHPGGYLYWGAVKEFADGSLGSRTALMWQPYEDDANSRGLRQCDPEVFAQRAKAAAVAGLQLGVHAIGDKAVDEVLQVLAPLSSSSSSSSSRGCRRHRIEHVQHISSAAVGEQLAAAGVVAVTNPLHLLTDRAVLEQRLGRERAGAGRAFAYKTLGDAGATLAHASDWPVVDVDPLGSVYAAAFRKSAEGDEAAWVAEEQVSVEQALLAHTAAAAAAVCAEGRVGRLAEGMLADFVVLSSSPLKWRGTAADVRPSVLQTYVGGKCVHGCGPLVSPQH